MDVACRKGAIVTVNVVRLQSAVQSSRYKNWSKNSGKVLLFFVCFFGGVIFICTRIDVFCPFFAFRLKMHVRCNNWYKTRAWVIGVLSPAHEYEMRGSLVYLLIVKYLSMLVKFSHGTLNRTALSWNFSGIFKSIFIGICRQYHLQGL